jgi:hypothetical protein
MMRYAKHFVLSLLLKGVLQIAGTVIILGVFSTMLITNQRAARVNLNLRYLCYLSVYEYQSLQRYI